ncbi:hypothetical protein [Streptomyces sp. 900105755]
MSRFEAYANRLAAALRGRTAGTSAIDALEEWLRQETSGRSELDDLADRMLALNPQLKAAGQARPAEVIEEGARILAEEKGASSGDIGPRIAAAAAAVIVGAPGPHPVDADITAAMAFLRAGISALPYSGDPAP